MITYKYFLEECGRFFNIMGDRHIMTNEIKREAAKNGLCYSYVRMQCSNEERERAESSFEGMMHEYTMRCIWLDLQDSIV